MHIIMRLAINIHSVQYIYVMTKCSVELVALDKLFHSLIVFGKKLCCVCSGGDKWCYIMILVQVSGLIYIVSGDNMEGDVWQGCGGILVKLFY